MEAPSKAFLLFFLLPDWLKFNHLKSRMECSFSDIFSRHICSTVAETIDVTNYEASFGAKNVQKTTFEAAEMILGPWNQEKGTGVLKWDRALLFVIVASPKQLKDKLQRGRCTLQPTNELVSQFHCHKSCKEIFIM